MLYSLGLHAPVALGFYCYHASAAYWCRLWAISRYSMWPSGHVLDTWLRSFFLSFSKLKTPTTMLGHLWHRCNFSSDMKLSQKHNYESHSYLLLFAKSTHIFHVKHMSQLNAVQWWIFSSRSNIKNNECNAGGTNPRADHLEYVHYHVSDSCTDTKTLFALGRHL